MADELFDGNILQNITLAKAMVQNILPTPKYVSALYSFDSYYKKLKRKIEARETTNKSEYLRKLKELRTNWNNSAGVPLILKKHLPADTRKVLVCCKDIAHLQKVRSNITKWFYKAFNKRINIYELHTELSSKKVFREFERAKQDEMDILLVINMLNEGIHTKGIDAVIMLRDTMSPNIYYQQIGRCMSVQMGVKPIVLDFVNNFQNMRSSELINEYELECMKIINPQLQKEICSYKFIVIDEIKDILELYNALSNSIEKWELKYQEICDFYFQFGHTRIPPSNKLLHTWVSNQRALYRKGRLEQHRQEKLDEINFDWQFYDNYWQGMFLELKEYFNIQNHCRVPKKQSTLNTWCLNQRKAFRENRLSLKQIKKLNSISIDWYPKHTRWVNMHSELEAFFKKNGHSRVPMKHKELNSWCIHLRVRYHKGKLSESEIEQLNKIEFPWEIFDASWQENYLKLLAYQQETGHCMVPKSYDITLAGWVFSQMGYKKANRISMERESKLNEIGFIWDVEDYFWEDNFSRMREHLRVTKRTKPLVSSAPTYCWYKAQKLKYKQGKLSEKRIKKLKSINMDIG